MMVLFPLYIQLRLADLMNSSNLNTWSSVFVLTLFTFFSPHARADNYIFYDGTPLFKLASKGQFKDFSLLIQDTANDQFKLNQILYQNIPYLWSYREQGKAVKHEVSKLDFDASPSPCHPTETIILKGSTSEGLLTSLPLPSPRKPTLIIVDDERKVTALKILDTALKRRHVTAAWRDRLAEMVSVHEVQLREKHPGTLLVQLQDTWKKKSISVLLLLASVDEKAYSVSYSEINIGGPSGSEPEAPRIRFIDYLDPGAGNDSAILLQREGYETIDWLLLKQSPKDKLWHEVAKREEGC